MYMYVSMLVMDIYHVMDMFLVNQNIYLQLN